MYVLITDHNLTSVPCIGYLQAITTTKFHDSINYDYPIIYQKHLIVI